MISSCAVHNSHLEEIVIDYLDTYNKRQDFNKFLSFYEDEIVLEDIINGDRMHSKENLKDFFDWDNPLFSLLDSNSLTAEQIVIDHQTVVIKGYFHKFKWQQTEFEAMHFTTILTFNSSNKIIKQLDWINYPSSLVDYENRKNSNLWLE